MSEGKQEAAPVNEILRIANFEEFLSDPDFNNYFELTTDGFVKQRIKLPANTSIEGKPITDGILKVVYTTSEFRDLVTQILKYLDMIENSNK